MTNTLHIIEHCCMLQLCVSLAVCDKSDVSVVIIRKYRTQFIDVQVSAFYQERHFYRIFAYTCLSKSVAVALSFEGEN